MTELCSVCAVDGRRTRLHRGACWMHGTQTFSIREEGMKMKRAEWRALAKEAQRLAKAEHLVDGVRLIWHRVDCRLIKAKRAAERLRDIPDIDA